MSFIFETEMLESKDVCIVEKMWEDFLEDEERIPETLNKQTNRSSGNNYNKTKRLENKTLVKKPARLWCREKIDINETSWAN